MKLLQLLPIGNVRSELLPHLARSLAETFDMPCEIIPARMDPKFAMHAERGQFHSTEILRRLQNYVTAESWRILGVTELDLYIPILTFVFGEAQLGGPCAVVSAHRLTQEFYGLPPDADLLAERLVKEAVHEIGHTLDLTHCDDYRCAMAPSHAVEWIDLKEAMLCLECRSRTRSSCYPIR
jgi:archaemetzincin